MGRKRKNKTPAHMKQEGDSSIISPSTESDEDSRPRKKKKAADETNRRQIMVSQVAGASTSCQNMSRTMRRPRSDATKLAEETSPPAKKKKRLLQRVRPKERLSSWDISSESSSFSPALWSTGVGDLRKRNLRRQKTEMMEMDEESEDSQGDQSDFIEKYIELDQLGEGGFGFVFSGYRVEDKLPVAIKRIPKENVVIKHKGENGRELAMEVAVMLEMRSLSSSLGQSAFVTLLDWYDLDEHLIIVMERPMPSDNLSDYLMEHNGCLKDKEAKIILKQLVEAALYLQNANIFHRDIKVENILIKTTAEGLQVYLIDFGLSCFDDRREHELFCGTPDHFPLDWYINTNYRAGPTTVWQLGVVLYEIVHRHQFQTSNFLSKKLRISKRLSKNCQDVLTKCLMVDPVDRPTLEQLLGHPWFS
ncbi:serine/threonine-protein kinase pim-2-like [Poeciliopsis prolifica]|uniref:serine/threonine-protein kinase pim-2-like n=1 Tax=Poeciliopsis prolifica TaxID=188132 RepID=UPI002413085B|nr:serine/threonine-protein kinase pim-2-like [Poeciliopsis prolifica]